MSPDIKLMALCRRNEPGGSGTELIELTARKNGIYRAPPGKGYSPVRVETPEVSEETEKTAHIVSLQTNTPVFSDATTYTARFPLGYFRETFGDYLEINCPNAFYLGGGASFMPFSKTSDPVDTPDTVKITLGTEPIIVTNSFYGTSGTISSTVNEKGIKTFILRSGESNVIKIRVFSSFAFRNNITKNFDCIFDMSLLTGNISGIFGTAVENLTFRENTLGCNFNITECGRLNLESVISVANALNTVTSPLTITLHSDIKQLCSRTYVTLTNVTYAGQSFKYAAAAQENDEGAMTLTYFITQIKGWTIA